jgi:hypothetical protein
MQHYFIVYRLVKFIVKFNFLLKFQKLMSKKIYSLKVLRYFQEFYQNLINFILLIDN